MDKYSAQFNEFGQLPFKTEVGEREQGGGNPEKFYLLNEDQTYFLMTLVRNTAQAVELKKRLVQAFAEARRPAPTFDLATMTGQALRELACKIEECAALNARVITMQPKADFYDHVAGSDALFERATDGAASHLIHDQRPRRNRAPCGFFQSGKNCLIFSIPPP